MFAFPFFARKNQPVGHFDETKVCCGNLCSSSVQICDERNAHVIVIRVIGSGGVARVRGGVRCSIILVRFLSLMTGLLPEHLRDIMRSAHGPSQPPRNVSRHPRGRDDGALLSADGLVQHSLWR